MSKSLDTHILIVDDENNIRQLCQRILATDYCTQTVENGEEALHRLVQTPFDIVITDLVMPGSLDGSHLLKEIKQRSINTDVIIMTGFPTLETAIPTLKQGAYDYLIKPFDKELLRQVVSRCVEKRCLSHDLNQEKKIREELEAAYLQLQEVEELKEAFLSRVNHELSVPLMPALLGVDILLKIVKEPQEKEICQMLGNRLNHLYELIQTVLLFSRLKQSQLASSKKSVNLLELLKKVVEDYKTVWKEKELKVNLDWQANVEHAHVDVQLINRAFQNLFLNAIRFTPFGESITLLATLKGPHDLEISFSNTGIHIPEDKIPHLFSGFYQVAHYMTREIGGLGLGLAIVKSIVDLHKGSITVSSSKAHGTTFNMRLPL